MPSDIDTVSNTLFTSLTSGVTFTIPTVDLSGPEFQFPGDETAALYQAVTKLSNDDLTDGNIEGTGTFDALMRGFKAHLNEEYDKGRIQGAEYTKAYIALTEAAMANATQYLLGREEAFWNAITGQMNAINARAGIELQKQAIAKAVYDANTAKAQFAKMKISLGTDDKNYQIADYNLTTMLPANLQLVEEKVETERAQTMDTRTDGVTTITGSVGKQKELYTQQIWAYERDSEIKAAKIFADSWITQKTIDEGLTAPTVFTNASLDAVLGAVKTNLSLT